MPFTTMSSTPILGIRICATASPDGGSGGGGRGGGPRGGDGGGGCAGGGLVELGAELPTELVLLLCGVDASAPELVRGKEEREDAHGDEGATQGRGEASHER